MQTPMKIAVAGATGRVGRHVVDVLRDRGHDVVPIARATGVDVISGDGLTEALAGVETIVDVTTGPSPEQAAATEFFTTETRNLQQRGEQAGVRRIVVVSIIGIDRLRGGYGVAKLEQERAAMAGPIPVRILRASQFHEFVAQLMDWGRQGDVAYVPKMKTQLVAARSVAEALAGLATDTGSPFTTPGTEIPEIAGPRPEELVEMAALLAIRRGDPVRVEGVSDPSNPDSAANEAGGLLPGPHATLAGPTFAEWLAATQV